MSAAGWNLRRLRLLRGLSQEKLASASGCGPDYLGRVERGVITPSAATLMKLAKALGVELAELQREIPEGAVRLENLPPGRPRGNRNSDVAAEDSQH
jgi:transcriptional regulator with XRE-family HTH domain